MRRYLPQPEATKAQSLKSKAISIGHSISSRDLSPRTAHRVRLVRSLGNTTLIMVMVAHVSTPAHIHWAAQTLFYLVIPRAQLGTLCISCLLIFALYYAVIVRMRRASTLAHFAEQKCLLFSRVVMPSIVSWNFPPPGTEAQCGCYRSPNPRNTWPFHLCRDLRSEGIEFCTEIVLWPKPVAITSTYVVLVTEHTHTHIY